MSIQQPDAEKSLRSRLFLPTLLLGVFLTFKFTIFLSNAMINVAATLKITVGTTSQILTISSLVGLIVGFIMGFLTVKFNHKSLFLLGVALFGVGALGWFFASDFTALLFFSFFLGIGAAMAWHCGFRLNRRFFAFEKKRNGSWVSDGWCIYRGLNRAPGNERNNERCWMARCHFMVYLSNRRNLFALWLFYSAIKTAAGPGC